VAYEVLGARCLALTTVSSTTPEHDADAANELAARIGATHLVVPTDELAVPGYAENPVDRCYLCKDNLFTICRREAAARGIAAILDGANRDDLSDHRPGLAAAAAQGVRHPLVEAGFTKRDVREASHALDLPTWDRPASPCLSSRIPYGTTITVERLRRVDAAERFLRDAGLGELRVRLHEDVARIEVCVDAMPRLLASREAVVAEFRRLGCRFVTLDLVGFRSGSLNEGLDLTATASPPSRH